MSSNLAAEHYGKVWLYVGYGFRCNVLLRIMWDCNVTHVPVVGYIEELGWQGPQVIGVISDRDIAMACWSRNNRPKNICSESVMQRDIYNLYGDTSTRQELEGLYGAIAAHYKATHDY